MKRILIADDHDIVRFGLKVMLEKHFATYAIDEAWDADSVMEQMKKNTYEVVLLDLNMPHTDALVLLHYIRNFHPDCKVLVISMNEEALYGLRSIHSGAHGYISKDALMGNIVQAIHTILSGKRYVSEILAGVLLQHSLEGKSLNPFERLSPREFQVAMYIVKDFSPRQISEMLQVQYGSVNTLKQRIYEKLDITHRKDLVELVSAYGLQ
jgi:two-component system invasion response regulator UvrY